VPAQPVPQQEQLRDTERWEDIVGVDAFGSNEEIVGNLGRGW
jgi:hypothetical protein